MKPNQKFGLKHIEVPKDCNNWNNMPKSKKIQWDIVTDPEKNRRNPNRQKQTSPWTDAGYVIYNP